MEKKFALAELSWLRTDPLKKIKSEAVPFTKVSMDLESLTTTQEQPVEATRGAFYLCICHITLTFVKVWLDSRSLPFL